MLTGTLTPGAALTLKDRSGFIVAFPAGCVSADVVVNAGKVGALTNAPSSGFDVYGDLYRIGFETYELLLKDVFVQLPYTAADATGGGVCTCIAKPYYPDPMPWMPGQREFAVLENWQQLPNVTPHDTGKRLACETRRLGYMIAAKKY